MHSCVGALSGEANIAIRFFQSLLCLFGGLQPLKGVSALKYLMLLSWRSSDGTTSHPQQQDCRIDEVLVWEGGLPRLVYMIVSLDFTLFHCKLEIYLSVISP